MPSDIATSQRMYSLAQITTASLIGGPLPACILIARNWRHLGNRRQHMWWIIGGIAGDIIVLAIVLLVTPERLPPYVLPVAYTIALRETVKRLQGKAITDYRGAGGRLGSWWAVVGLGILGLILVFALIFMLPASLIPSARP